MNLIIALDEKSEIGDPGGVKGLVMRLRKERRGLELSFNMLIVYPVSFFTLPLYFHVIHRFWSLYFQGIIDVKMSTILLWPKLGRGWRKGSRAFLKICFKAKWNWKCFKAFSIYSLYF